MSKETLVNKSETFEDWRLKSNEVSLDLGAVASDATYTAPSLDTESRLTDQYITKSDLGDGELYIRDLNDLDIDKSGDRTVDNTDGYLILKDGVTTKFPVGTKLCQYANNSPGTTILFSAIVVSCSANKILLSNIDSPFPFNPSLNIYDSGSELYQIFIASTYLKELIVESYSHGNVRVYRTRNYQFNGAPANNQSAHSILLSSAAYYAIQDGDIVTYTTPQSGGIYGSPGDVTTFFVKKEESYTNTEINLSLTQGGANVNLQVGSGNQSLSTSRVALPQDMSRDGFHIAPHNYFVTTNASSIPVTFIEGEVLYQGNNANDTTFKGTLYTADVPGLLIFKNILSGTFSSTVDLKSTTETNGAGTTLSAANIKIANANLTSTLTSTSVDVSQMIEFNMPTVAGDDYKVYFGSAVDAVLELQDDVGTVESLQTNNTTDLTVAINELELGLRGASDNLVETDLASTTNRPAFTANNIVSALVEHEVDLFGASKSLSDLGTTDQGDFVLAINELETAIRGGNTELVSADLLSTSSPSSHPAMTATNLIDAILEHEVDLYGTGSQDLGSLTTNNQYNFVAAINELETAIRGTNAGLVLTDLGVTLAPYNNSAVNLVDHNEELQRDIGDVTNAKLGLLNTPNVTLATHGSVIAQGATVLTMVSSPIAAGIKVGMFVTSQHSPNSIDTATGGGTFVTAVSATQVTLSRATTGALTSAALIFKVEDIVTKIKDLDDVLGDIALINNDTFYSDITFTDTTVKDSINSITDYIGGTDIGAVINSGNETLTNAIAQLYTDIGEVGAAGINIVDSNYNANTTDLKKAVIAAAVGMTGSVEFDTAFHASSAGSLAEKSGYSSTDLHAGIRELQTYVGDASTLSTSGDTVTTHIETAGGSAHTGNSTTTLTLASPATFAQVDVGYQVQINVNGNSYQNGDESQIPSGTKVVRRISSTEFELNNAVTVDTTGGVTDNLAFSKTADYGFQNDVITDALIELRNALVGGTADLTDKINTLDDADGAASDFSVTNVVDAIRELQEDIGQRSLITAGPFHSDINGTYNTTNIVTVLNAITAAIGSHDIGDAVNTGNETLTNAIAQLRIDIGDAGSSGDALTTTATDLTTAINELHNDLGPISNAKLGTNANRSIAYASGGADGATTVTLTSVSGLVEGMNVAGTNIPAGTKISSISSNTITLTQAISGGATSGNLVFTTEDVQSAILANDKNIGETQILDNAVGYTKLVIAPAITEIQGLIGDIQDNNEAPILNSVNTRITRDTDTEVTTGATIAMPDTTGITVGMKVKNTAAGRTGSIAAGTLVQTVNVGTSIVLNADIVSTINSSDTLQFDSPTVVNAVRTIDARIGQEVTPSNMGTTATTLVTAIKEITDEIGDVTAGNLGTASDDITAAIKEIIDGTGQANVQVGAGATGGATIARNAANGGFLKKVKAGFGADAQTIVSNLNFDAAGPTDVLHKTTMKFGANTVLDVSLATLITEAADANFDTTARKIVFGSTVNDGQGIEIDRSNGLSGDAERTISGAVGNLGIDPSILWVDGEVSARDPSAATATATTGGSATASGATTITVVSTGNLEAGMVVTSNVAGALVPGTFIANIINSTSFGISQATTAIIPAGTTLNFDIHSRNDLGWKVKGFKPTSTPDAADSFYQAPNVDFYNAGRLFGKGTSGIDSTQNGVTVTWDPVTQHFDTSLQTIPGLSAGTTGGPSVVPVITVDTFGRITAVTTANVTDSLGAFNLHADSGTQQIIGVNKTVKILGTTNEIETALTESNGVNTVTVGLPSNVTIGNDLTVTDRLIVNGTSNDPSSFAGDVQIDGDLNVQGSITVGSSSLSFTTTSATVSSKQIILNALADTAQADIASGTGQATVPAASFVAHRGFKSTVLSGNTGTLTKGLRYKIKSSGASNAITAAEQAAIKLVSGATDDHVHNEVITATTTGNSNLNGFSNITFREQQIEAKIAWNEATDQWELYRGTDVTQGAIVTQSDTFFGALASDAQVTPFNSTDTENYNLLHFPAEDNREKLYQNDSLTFNPGRKDLKLNGRMAIGGTGVPDGSTFFNPLAQLHIKTNINSEDATLILESDHDNDNELSNPVLQLIQDGRRVRSAIQMTGQAEDGATGARRNALLFSTSAENIPGNAYMHFATGGAITVTDGDTDIALDSTADWKGWNEVYLKDQNGGEGALQYGFTPGMDASGRANQKITFTDANDQVSLGANTFYSSSSSDGLFIDTNGDGQNETDIRINQAGTDGGAYMKISSFREDLTWHGRNLTFSGDVGPALDADNMHSSYEVFAFIKYVIRSGTGPMYEYRLGAIEQVDIRNLSGTSFSLSLSIPNNFELAATELAIPQIGFTVNGVNAVANTQRATGDLDVTNLAATVSEVLTGGADDAAAGNPLITTKPQVRMTITSDTGNVGVATTAPGAKLDVHGNFRVEGDQNSSFPITTGDGAEDDDLLHTAVFASNNLSQANTLSSTITKQLKQAVFVSRPGYGGALSYLDITDVRTTNGSISQDGSAKRIQSRTSTNKNEQGDRKGFISFPGNSNLVEIGGVHTAVDKVGVSTNSGGPTQIFHNTADATASSKKLETTATGVEVSDTLYVKQFVGIGNSNPVHPLVVQRNDGTIAQIKAIDTGGSQPAMTATLNMQGYEGRGLGLRLQDNSTSLENPSSREWFVGTPYATNTFGIGYASDGVESMYSDQNKLTILPDGKVGIGTVTPTTPLHIMAANTLGTSFTGTTKGQGLTISQSEYTAENHISLIEGSYVGSNNSNHPHYRIGVKFTGAEGSFLKFGTSTNYSQGVTNTAMVIDHEGRVGIGVNEHVPAVGEVAANNNGVLAKLHVNGTGQFEGKLTINSGIDTTGNIRIGHGTLNGALFTGEINAVDTGLSNQHNRHIYINAGESWALSDNADRIDDQGTEKVYINAEYGLEVTSHPSNWTASGSGDSAVAAGWAGKNNPVKINQADGSSEFNQIQHTGLQLTMGSGVDQIAVIDIPSDHSNTEWQDLDGLSGNAIPTGTYMVQLHVDEGAGGQYNEFYSGIMSWYADAVNADQTDEIFLHNAGHAPHSDGASSRNWFLRTKRTSNTGTGATFVAGKTILQYRTSYVPPAGTHTYTLKLRRLM